MYDLKPIAIYSSFEPRLGVQTRAAVLTAAQCATYDEAKKAWMLLVGGGDSLSTHVGASMVSGLVTTTLTAPVDVIKTNMFVGGHTRQSPIPCSFARIQVIQWVMPEKPQLECNVSLNMQQLQLRIAWSLQIVIRLQDFSYLSCSPSRSTMFCRWQEVQRPNPLCV